MADGEERREKAWRLTKKSYSVKVRMTAPIYDAMLRVLETGAYLNLPEYVIDLIRQNLKERGLELEAMKVSGEGEEDEDTKMRPSIESAVVSTRVPIPVMDAIEEVLDSGFYYKTSDYLREIIKRDLDSRGIGLKSEETETGFIQARVPIPMRKAIEEVLESGFYFEVSDYLRHIIKKDLEERGLLPEPKVKAEPEEED